MNTASRGSGDIVPGLISPDRFSPYLDTADGDIPRALDLYAWSARMSSAAFELIAHLEVALRNALDAQLRHHLHEDSQGIPWLFCSPPVNTDMSSAIRTTRDRLRGQRQNSRGQIIANLSFGFWAGMLGTRHDELWRQSLRHAFPYSDGTRKTVAVAVEGIRKFRNRVAHHDSLLSTDIPFEVARIFAVAGYLDPVFETWLRSVDRTDEVYRQRPVTSIDTVLVPARRAWNQYLELHAYICQPGRWSVRSRGWRSTPTRRSNRSSRSSPGAVTM